MIDFPSNEAIDDRTLSDSTITQKDNLVFRAIEAATQLWFMHYIIKSWMEEEYSFEIVVLIFLVNLALYILASYFIDKFEVSFWH